MKKLFLLAIILFSGLYVQYGSAVTSSSDSLRIFCTPELHGLVVAWSEEYNRTNTTGKVSIITATEASAPDMLRKGIPGFAVAASPVTAASSWKMIVGRDVIVPVFNSGNPLAELIATTGITSDRLIEYFSSPENRTWGMLLGTTDAASAQMYCIDDVVLEKGISDYFGISAGAPGWMKTMSEQELLSAVKGDRLAFGFCRLADMMEGNTELIAGISILPIDRNNDGRIGPGEDIYKDLNAFSRGVWIGKYPSGLIQGIYSISSGQPTDEQTVAFLKWILDRGQQYLGEEGYTALIATERQSVADKLAAARLSPAAPAESPSIFRTLLLVLVIIAALVFVANVAVSLFRRRPAEEVAEPQRMVLDDQSVELPKGIYFDKTHTWAFLEKDGNVRVGVDDFMHHITGRISSIGMKSEGEMVKKGEEILSLIRNGKQLTLYSPVTGIIRQTNHQLENDAEPVNVSPYDEGWVYMIEPANWLRECQLLMMAEKHRQYIQNEILRLRDFMAEVLTGKNLQLSPLILQDGGELLDSPLADMSPEVWEDFQSKFIDPSRHIWFYELY